MNPSQPGNLRGPISKKAQVSKRNRQNRNFGTYKDNITVGKVEAAPVSDYQSGRHAGSLPDTSSTSANYVGHHRAWGSHAGESYPTLERHLGDASTGGSHRAESKHRADGPSFGSNEATPVPAVGRHKAQKSGGMGRIASFFNGVLG